MRFSTAHPCQWRRAQDSNLQACYSQRFSRPLPHHPDTRHIIGRPPRIRTLTNWVGASHATVTPETYIFGVGGGIRTLAHRSAYRFSKPAPSASWVPRLICKSGGPLRGTALAVPRRNRPLAGWRGGNRTLDPRFIRPVL